MSGRFTRRTTCAVALGVCWFVVSLAHATAGACSIGYPAIPGASSRGQGQVWEADSVSYLGETHDVLAYLPMGYPDHAPYPVVYLLHGWAMGPEMWVRADIQAEADRHGYVLVAPEGDAADVVPAWYSCQAYLPFPGGTDWEVSFCEWFYDGVMPHVERTYAVRRDSGGRAIVGYSMGGKGALSLAALRPDLFAATVAYGAVVDLRDYAALYEIASVYGPLESNELRYAADSPIELAANLKGLSISLFHGAEDTEWVHFLQSRRLHEALDSLGYPHVWEELPGVEHDVTTYMITRTCEILAQVFRAPSVQRTPWRFRFADRETWQVYDALLTKTDPLTWTEVREVRTAGFEAISGDAFRYRSAPVYEPSATYVLTVTNLSSGHVATQPATSDALSRLTVRLDAGSYAVSVASASPGPTGVVTPTPLSTREPTVVATQTLPRPTVPNRWLGGCRLPLILRSQHVPIGRKERVGGSERRVDLLYRRGSCSVAASARPAVHTKKSGCTAGSPRWEYHGCTDCASR